MQIVLQEDQFVTISINTRGLAFFKMSFIVQNKTIDETKICRTCVLNYFYRVCTMYLLTETRFTLEEIFLGFMNVTGLIVFMISGFVGVYSERVFGFPTVYTHL